jgi:hypothetical protein
VGSGLTARPSPDCFRHWTVVVVASGPSLSDEQCELVRRGRLEDRCRVVAVNDNYQRVPADWLVAYDAPWWSYHGARIGKSCSPDMVRWTLDTRAAREFGAHLFVEEQGRGMADEGCGRVRRGTNSGFGAVGLCVEHGARRILLVGVDCKPGADGRKHWFGDHPPRLPATQPFVEFAADFDSLADPAAERGIQIINCTIDSAVRKLPRGDLAAELFPRESNEARVSSSQGSASLPS